MEKKMENYKETGRRLSRRFSSRKRLLSLKGRFKKFLSDHQLKAGEAEVVSSATGSDSDSDTDGRETSSPPARSGVIKKSSGSSPSSDTDEESPSKLEKKKKSDSSPDSLDEKTKKKGRSNSSEKKLQFHLQQERKEFFGLSPLEETPPTSPQSNPRFSTGADSDYGRLWTHASVPNSPANLAHNLNISYRGGDSSPVALVHSLSVRERGKNPSQLSEIPHGSPPRSSSLDHDVLGVKSEDMTASPSKTTPSLKPNGLPIVHHDEEQGVWRCGSCGWIYPNPNPSLRNRRQHKQHCGEISNVQRWLGAQDIRDAPEERAVKLVEDSEVWEGSGLHDILSTADEHSMGKFDRKDDNEGVSDRSADHHGSVDEGRLDNIEPNGSPDHDAGGDEGNGGRSPSAAANPHGIEDQKLNRVLEWPSLDNGTKGHSSADEIPSDDSTDHHEVKEHSKSEDLSIGSTAHYGIEEASQLDDSPTFITPEVEANEEEITQVFGSEVEAHERQLNQKSQEGLENEGGDEQVEPVNGNGRRSFAVVDSNVHDLVHVDNIGGFKEGENANQDINDDLNHPGDVGLTEVPEVHSEQSAPTRYTGVGEGQAIHVVRNKDDLDTKTPCDDEFSKDAVDAKTIESEPRVIAHKGRPIVLARVVREPDVMEPTLSTADLQSEDTEIEKRDVKALKAVTHDVTNVDKVIPKLCEPSQNSSLETEKDPKTNGFVSDYSGEQKVSASESVEENSTRELPFQENGIRTENGGRVAPPSPLEEAPKWMNSGVITSQDEGDTFTSMQKYWAGRTGSEYLLVEGKRSPSFGSCDNIGFPSFKNGEGRRSPSPFSLSKSGDGEVQSSPSLVSLDYRSTADDKIEEWAVPSLAVIHHHGSSSSSAHVDYDLEKVVHEQSTHYLICPACGSDVTKRIILRKRKRFRGQEDHGRESKERPGGRVEDQMPQVDESDDETWGCFDCLSFFIRRGGGEGRVSQSGAEEQTPSASGEPVETDQERVRCLPTLFRWEQGTSKPELKVPLLGDTAREEVAGEVPEPRPVNTGSVYQVSLDDDDKVSCFSYLQRSKSSGTSKEVDNAAIAKPMPVSSVHGQEVPSDEDERVSCFSYLQRPKQKTPVNEEATEEPSASNFQAQIQDEAPNPHQGEGVGEHGELPDKDHESVIQLPDGIGVSQQRETVEKENCECLPFFSFRSESFFPAKIVTGTRSPPREIHPVEDPNKEGTSESLPASVPAFPWGTPSNYDFSPSPGVLSSHPEITDSTEEASTLLTQEHQVLEDGSEKRSCNCLPEVLSVFSWGPIPVYTHPPLDTFESAQMEQDEDRTAVSPIASVTQEPRPQGVAEEKGTFNCLTELPSFTWGRIPVYTHPPPDTYEFSGEEQYEEASAGIPSASETREPQVPEDSGENRSCNCLPGLSTFSWRSIPGNDTQMQSSPQATPGCTDEVTVDRDEDLQSSHLKAKAKESATCACLPLLFPAFRWGYTMTTYENDGLQEPLLQDPPAAGPVPLDDTSTDPIMETTGTPDPAVEGSEGLDFVPARPVTNGGGTTEITVSENIHVEGIVSGQKITTEKPSGKPADVTNSATIHQSNYHFGFDIEDGHFTGTVEKLKPGSPPLNISNGDTVSSTPSYLSAGSSGEPERAPVEYSPVIEGDLDEFQHYAQAIANHILHEDVAAPSNAVSQPVENTLGQTFPAEEIVEDQAKNEHLSCNCFPTYLPILSWWRPPIDSTVGEGLEGHLQDGGNGVDVSPSTSETEVELPRGRPSMDGTRERCNCLPSFPKFSLYDVLRDHHVPAGPRLPEGDDITTPLLGRPPLKPHIAVEIETTQTTVAVEGATTAEAIAIAEGQSPSAGDLAPSEYLKSIVHGGLDVTLVSLGVVSSGSGGDAKTITVIAIGLANLVFGLLTHLSTIMSLYYNNRAQFQLEVGQGVTQGCLSVISFLFFGALPPITYGFSFRSAKTRNYKFAATCVVALVSIVLLGAAKARVKSKSAVRVISTLIVTGFLAAVAGYETGNLVAQLLEQIGFSSV